MTTTRIIIRGVDLTEHVKDMFDALVSSLDWGSGFLDVETIEAVLIVGEVLGIDMREHRIVCDDFPGVQQPPPDATYEIKTAERERAIEAWRRQISAKVKAMLEDAQASEARP